MPSRRELDHRARVVGIDPANYVNDSKLEQRILWNEANQATVTGTLTSGTVTSTGTANTDGDTVTIAPVTYTFKTALTEVVSTNTLTSNNTNVSNGDTVTINALTYRFQTTITKPYDVNIGASADASLTNLVSAITAAGTIGTDYGTGTVVNPDVTAAAVGSHATVITALTAGTRGNNFTLIPTAATLTATGVNFTAGVDPIGNQVLIGSTSDGSAGLTNLKAAILGTTSKGTLFSNGTIAHPYVTGSTLGATTLLVRGTKSSSGITVSTTGSTGGAQLSWGATTMQTNVQAVVAQPSDQPGAQAGAALV